MASWYAIRARAGERDDRGAASESNRSCDASGDVSHDWCPSWSETRLQQTFVDHFRAWRNQMSELFANGYFAEFDLLASIGQFLGWLTAETDVAVSRLRGPICRRAVSGPLELA